MQGFIEAIARVAYSVRAHLFVLDTTNPTYIKHRHCHDLLLTLQMQFPTDEELAQAGAKDIIEFNSCVSPTRSLSICSTTYPNASLCDSEFLCAPFAAYSRRKHVTRFHLEISKLEERRDMPFEKRLSMLLQMITTVLPSKVHH